MATGERVITDGWVLIHERRIRAVGHGRPPQGVPVVPAGRGLVAPGFVDVHVHGGGGQQVSGDTPEEVAGRVATLCAHHVRHGTTAVVAATVSDSPERLETAVRGIALSRDRRSADQGQPAILGAHLEGPWLAPGRRGAHDPSQLRLPDPDELRRLVAAAEGTVRLVTLAPELPGASEVIAAARAAGVVVSVGHTEADFAATRAAFDAGASHVTHLGNAMAGIDRRAPGPVSAALLDSRVTVEVIADGHHLHQGFLSMVAAAVPDRIVAVTDAVGACGMPPGPYLLGRSRVLMEDGRVVLADQPETLAGSILTMDRAVGTLVAAGLDLSAAVAAATATPARVAGAAERGRLVPGAPADVVILDERFEAEITVVEGTVAWDRHGRVETN